MFEYSQHSIFIAWLQPTTGGFHHQYTTVILRQYRISKVLYIFLERKINISFQFCFDVSDYFHRDFMTRENILLRTYSKVYRKA
jgi:hypothetical protein